MIIGLRPNHIGERSVDERHDRKGNQIDGKRLLNQCFRCAELGLNFLKARQISVCSKRADHTETGQRNSDKPNRVLFIHMRSLRFMVRIVIVTNWNKKKTRTISGLCTARV